VIGQQLIVEYEKTAFSKIERDKRAREIPTSDICPEAQERWPRLGLEEWDTVWELRLGYKKWRGWGVLDGPAFHMVWWDPDHTVCQTMPRDQRRS